MLHFEPPIAGGEADLQWSIRADDSHALTGEFAFTVDVDDPIDTSEPAEAATTPEPLTPDPSESSAGDEGAGTESDDAAADLEAATAPQQSADATIQSVPVVADPDPIVSDAELNGSAAMQLVGLVGRVIRMIGSLVSIGALIVLVRILRGSSGEGPLVTLVARRAALAVVPGAVLEATAQVAIQNGTWASVLSPVAWTDALSGRFGAAIALYLIGAFGVSNGSYFRRVAIGHQQRDLIRADLTKVGVLAAGHRTTSATNHPPLDNADEVGATLTPLLFRWQATSATSGAGLGIVALLAAAVVDGHTIGGPGPVMGAVVTVAHVLAGSVWVGGVVVLVVLLRRRFRALRRVEAVDLAVRYSVLATVSLVVVAVAGLALTISHLGAVSELWTTGWGRLVLAKLGLVSVAAGMGALNHFVVIPRLVIRTEDDGLGIVLKRLVSAEIVVLSVVVALSAQLVVTGL